MSRVNLLVVLFLVCGSLLSAAPYRPVSSDSTLFYAYVTKTISTASTTMLVLRQPAAATSVKGTRVDFITLSTDKIATFFIHRNVAVGITASYTVPLVSSDLNSVASASVKAYSATVGNKSSGGTIFYAVTLPAGSNITVPIPATDIPSGKSIAVEAVGAAAATTCTVSTGIWNQ